MSDDQRDSHNVAYGIILALIVGAVLFAIVGLARASSNPERSTPTPIAPSAPMPPDTGSSPSATA